MNRPGRQAELAGQTTMGPLAAGLFLLAAGAIFYLLMRPPGSTWINPAPWSLYGTLDVIGSAPVSALTFCLPSFVHAAALPLMTASVLGMGGRVAALSCIAWMAVDMGFELAQIHLLPGTFDPLDMAAIAAGALTAWIALKFHNNKRFE